MTFVHRQNLVPAATTQQSNPAALAAALADWSGGNLNAALSDLDTIGDDGDRDVLLGNLGDDQLFGGDGDWLAP